MDNRIFGKINILLPLDDCIEYHFQSDKSLVEVLVFTVDSLKLIYPVEWVLTKTTIDYNTDYIYIVFEL